MGLIEGHPEVLVEDIQLIGQGDEMRVVAEKPAFGTDYVFTPHKRVVGKDELIKELWEWSAHAFREENVMGIEHEAVFVEGPSVDWELTIAQRVVVVEEDPVRFVWSGFPKNYRGRMQQGVKDYV